MKDYFLSILIGFLFAPLTFGFIGLIQTNKLKIGGWITNILLFAALPVLLLAVPVAVVTLMMNAKIRIFYWIAIYIYLFAIYLIVRIQKHPAHSLKRRYFQDKKSLNLAYGRRLLCYSIFGNLFYAIPLTAGIVYACVKNASALSYAVSHPFEVLFDVLCMVAAQIIIPIMAIPVFLLEILSIIAITTISILFLYTFILSVNGIIRILYASKAIRKMAGLYIFLLLIPVVNLIGMLVVCRLAGKELKGISQAAGTAEKIQIQA